MSALYKYIHVAHPQETQGRQWQSDLSVFEVSFTIIETINLFLLETNKILLHIFFIEGMVYRSETIIFIYLFF